MDTANDSQDIDYDNFFTCSEDSLISSEEREFSILAEFVVLVTVD